MRRTADRLAAHAEAKDIALHVDAPESLAGYFDPDLISRVIWNLMDNAVKFTPHGGRVDVRLSAHGDQARLEVLDTGPGIPVEQLERLFERFYRADPSRTPSGEAPGAGLGLSIARAIVELHEGRVTAENRETGRAALRVELPSFGGVPRGRVSATEVPGRAA